MRIRVIGDEHPFREAAFHPGMSHLALPCRFGGWEWEWEWEAFSASTTSMSVSQAHEKLPASYRASRCTVIEVSDAQKAAPTHLPIVGPLSGLPCHPTPTRRSCRRQVVIVTGFVQSWSGPWRPSPPPRSSSDLENAFYRILCGITLTDALSKVNSTVKKSLVNQVATERNGLSSLRI
jgi:hypothetical protein